MHDKTIATLDVRATVSGQALELSAPLPPGRHSLSETRINSLQGDAGAPADEPGPPRHVKFDLSYAPPIESTAETSRTAEPNPLKRYRVVLDERERTELLRATRKGRHPAQAVINALILLNCDESALNERKYSGATVAAVLRISLRKVDRVKRRFVEGGLQAALGSCLTRPRDLRKTNDELAAQLLALSRSAPPQGHDRWSLRLLAEQAVERNYATSLSHETARRILKRAGTSLDSA